MTELEITGSLDDTGKDKNYYLYCWRLKKHINKIRDYASLIVEGKIVKDDTCCVVVDGMRWVK